MTIRTHLEDKAEDLHTQLAANAQTQFVKKVMDWDKVSWETAWNWCSGADCP